MMVSSLLPPVPAMTIQSDASNTGWGGCQGEVQTGGMWSKEEPLNHINYVELLAAFYGTPMLCKAEVQHHHPVKDGQSVSCDLQNGWDPLSGLVQPGNLTVELEPAAKHIPACRLPS